MATATSAIARKGREARTNATANRILNYKTRLLLAVSATLTLQRERESKAGFHEPDCAARLTEAG